VPSATQSSEHSLFDKLHLYRLILSADMASQTTSTPMSLNKLKLNYCRYFKKGKCSFGDDCMNSHSRAEQREFRERVSAEARLEHVQQMKKKGEENMRNQEASASSTQPVRQPEKQVIMIETTKPLEFADDFENIADLRTRFAAMEMDMNIKDLVDKCARGVGVDRTTAWADMNDDSSDDEVQFESDGAATASTAASSADMCEISVGKHARKRIWADVNEDASEDEAERNIKPAGGSVQVDLVCMTCTLPA